MASLRLDIGGGEDSSARSEYETYEQIGEWASSAAERSFMAEPSTSYGGYRDISAFRDLTQLHLGRHSTVWSAVCKRTGQTVVIKGYNRDSLKARQLNNVQREISLLRFFRNTGCKGVVTLLSTFEDESVIYLCFEACMRGDLYQVLMRNRGTLHEEFVVKKIVYPLLGVLQQLHKLHVVHRDIKPENIFVTEDGGVALGDFGLAAHKFQDRMNERVGTLDYMAPEVLHIPTHDHTEDDAAEGAKAYDEKVDIWAMGVLVFELLVGRPPFEVDDPHETAELIMHGKISDYPVHISQLAREFVAQALIKDPAARPSAEELLQHPWLRHHFGGKVPDPSKAAGYGVTAGLLKSWLVTSWSDLSRSGSAGLKPNSVAPNRLHLSPLSSPRKALSTGDDPSQPAHLEEDVKPSAQYKRKSVPGGSDAGSDSPRDKEVRKQLDRVLERNSHSNASSLDPPLQSPLGSDADGAALEREAAPNRLTASQYPSRDSSAGSMDQAVPPERVYLRNDSGASASSTLSVASFASLQHVPRSSSACEMGEQDDLGVVQRSASVCAANLARPPAGFPTSGGPQLKPAWQSNVASAGGVGSRKTPGKSRFAA